MKEAVQIVAAVKAVGEFSQVVGEVFGTDAVVGAFEPSLGIGDETVNPRQPSVEEHAIAMTGLKVDVVAPQTLEGTATIGIHSRRWGNVLIEKFLGENQRLAACNGNFREARPLLGAAFVVDPAFRFDGDESRCCAFPGGFSVEIGAV